MDAGTFSTGEYKVHIYAYIQRHTYKDAGDLNSNRFISTMPRIFQYAVKLRTLHAGHLLRHCTYRRKTADSDK